MTTIVTSTYLDARPERVRKHVMRSQLLVYVARGMIRFRPIQPPSLPDIWTDGQYKVALYLFGFLPLGWQVVGLETQPERGDVWSVRDNGHSWLITTWDHWIEAAPEGEGTRYVDRVTVAAGWLTPLIAVFARLFYAHRQRRWRRLVANGFDYER